MKLSENACRLIDKELTKYPADQKISAVMAGLRIVQVELGWLPTDAIEAVAEYLGIPPIAAYEVATFYNMYDTRKVGNSKIVVCTNLPCALSGGTDAAEYLKKKLGIDYNETTKDGLFTLKEGECMGACGDSPVMLVNNHRMCSFMSNEKIDALVEELKS
ncbi:NADH-quinone oxidoreductase subunit NuoE [Limnobacter sp.]|uniref:NADH-quinone oxidoreductase subunit NuoE n=1 Tax=Limnobacter sp. TaxID=2003368 RepID=UPI002FE1D599